jgi:hypothetical protein
VEGHGGQSALERMVYAHDRELRGSWSEHVPPKRHPGVLEQIEEIRRTIKVYCRAGGLGLGLLVARALGVPTEDVAKLLKGIFAYLFIH